MKKIIKSIAFLAGVTVLLVSCADKLNVTPPNSIYEEQITNILENGSDADKANILQMISNELVQYFNNYDRNNVCSTGSANVMNYSYAGIEWGRSLMGNDVALGFDETARANFISGKRWRYEKPRDRQEGISFMEYLESQYYNFRDYKGKKMFLIYAN